MPSAVLVWIWFCAYLNCAGWTLSALHELNAGGYAVALALAAGAFFIWKKKTSATILPRAGLKKINRRFRRPFPLAFLILAAMALLGGALYPPTNYDALAYRLPRILHWLAAEHWHWIHTMFARVNTRACGVEWVSAPFVSIFGTDRFLFLINFISFLFLPGLIFSVFTRLGVRRRTAWHWMWLVPTGYGFLLQAGSIGNDLFAAPFALAAVDYALRARSSDSPCDFFTSIVAAGMMTACKLSNLTLLLPWALAILPSARLVLRWPLRTAAVGVLALSASVLPVILENARHSGDWTGMELEQAGMVKAPVFKTGVNIVQLVIQNFVPPVFPPADRWNQLMDDRLPPHLIHRLDRTMESATCRFHVDQMQIEENAGLGFGISFLLLASVAAAFFLRKKISSGGSAWLACVRWSPVISLLVVLAESNLYPIARLLTPYYALLLPPLLACGGHERLVTKRWWRAAAIAVFFTAALPLVLSPARPLFPVETILAKIHKLPARVQIVYSVYRERHDAFAPALAVLPPGLKVLGLVTFDDPETSLWRPFGARRIEHVCPEDTASELKARGIDYILIKPGTLETYWHCSFDAWLKTMNAEIVQTIPLRLRAGAEGGDWNLVKLR